MKKLIALFLSLMIVLSLAACGSKNEAPAEPETQEPPVVEAPETEAPETEAPETEAPEAPETEAPEAEAPAADPELDDLLAKLESLVAGINDEMMVTSGEVTSDMYEYQLFIPYIEGSRAVTSAPMIGSIAHSVVLLKLPEGADVAAVAEEIEANMNPRKWVCVEAESSWVKTSGQYVLLVMSSQDMADGIAANFDTVFGA